MELTRGKQVNATGDAHGHRKYSKHTQKFHAEIVKVEKSYSYFPFMMAKMLKGRCLLEGSFSQPTDYNPCNPKQIAPTIIGMKAAHLQNSYWRVHPSCPSLLFLVNFRFLVKNLNVYGIAAETVDHHEKRVRILLTVLYFFQMGIGFGVGSIWNYYISTEIYSVQTHRIKIVSH